MLRRLALPLALLACSLPARESHAGGRVLRAADSPLFVSGVRVAQARAPKWTTAWLSLDVDGGPGRFVLVLPVVPGTKLDPALDAFFSALDTSTAPRIRPPKPVLACGATHESSLEDTSDSASHTLSPVTLAVLDSLSAVDSFAVQQGVAFDAQDAAKLGSVSSSGFVAIVYDLGQGVGTTETIRVSLPAPASHLGLGLLASDTAPEVSVFSIAEGRAAFTAGIDELGASALGTEWQVLAGTSSYAEDRRSTLLAALGGVAVIESSGSTPLFGWNVLPGGAGALAPGVKTYFERAKKEGAGIASPDLCVEPVWGAISAGKGGARLSRVCAAGSLVAVAGGQPCDELPAPGEISGAALRCGAADDVAFALSGLRADAVRITRHATVAGPATPTLADVGVGDGPAVSLVVTAASADTTGCVGGGGASGSGGTTGGAGYAGYGGGGGYGASTGYDPDPIVEPEPHVDVSCWVQVADSCGSSGSDGSGEDSCSGDSSGDAEGDTCSGDSSGSDAEGDTCSGDSSGSAEGDTCGGDSASGAEGDTCSGGDTGGGGDSCSSGSSSSGGDCSVPRRPRRLRVSALFLLFAAIALPLRRASRQRYRRA